MTSEFVKRSNKRSRLHVYDIEAKRLIDAFKDYGVPDETMDDLSTPEIFSGLLDTVYCSEAKINLQEVTRRIWDRNDDWCRQGISIILDGGNEENREKAMHMLLMRSVIAKAPVAGIDARICPMSSLIARLNDFGQPRYTFIDDICEHSTLIINDVAPEHKFREACDGRELFDWMLSRRQEKGNVTIFVLTSPSEKFVVAGELGRRFERMIKSGHSSRIWRIRIEGGTSS